LLRSFRDCLFRVVRVAATGLAVKTDKLAFLTIFEIHIFRLLIIVCRTY
jgi:hypothetical protein